MHLAVYQENFYFNIAKFTWNLEKLDPDWKNAIKINHLFRQMGISCLFWDDEIIHFCSYLNDDANSFLHFITGLSPDTMVTSKFDAFFDALVCKNYTLTEKISTLHPTKVNHNYEYEEEFYYFHFLMSYFQGYNEPGLNEILLKWEKVLDGNTDIRYDICKSLIKKDVVLFEESFFPLLQKWEQVKQHEFAEELVSPEVAETEGNISLEGIALMRLVEKAGINITDQFSYMPQDVMDFTPRVYDDENWKKIATV